VVALVDDESPLGRALAEQKRIKQIYTGKADDDTLTKESGTPIGGAALVSGTEIESSSG
jgi:hypothetical protein